MTERSDLDEFLEEEMRDPEFRALWDEMTPRVDFGIALARAREQRRMSLKALVDATGIPRAVLHRLEVGDEAPTLAMQSHIAHALNARLEIDANGRIDFVLFPLPISRQPRSGNDGQVRTREAVLASPQND